MSSTELDASLKKVAKGSGLIFIGTFAGMLLGFSCRIVRIRYITTSEYGLYTLSLAVVGILVAVASVGFTEGVPRYISLFRGKRDNGRIWGTIQASLQITFILGVVFSIITFFSARYISSLFSSPNLASAIRIISCAIPFTVITSILISIFRGFEDVKPKIYFQNILPGLINLILLGLVILFGWSFKGVLYAYLFSSVFIAVTLFIYAVKRLPSSFVKEKALSVKKDLFCFSFPLLISSFSGLILVWTDTLLLGYFKTPAIVGLYNAALPLAQNISLILVSVVFIYLPIASYYCSKKMLNDLKSLYAVITKWIFLLTLPLFLVLFLTPQATLHLLFGAKYIAAANTLQILSLGFFVHTFLGPNGMTLIALGRTKFVMFSSITSAISNVILNIILIPRFGLEGAAFASAISLSAANLMASIWLFKISRIHPFVWNYLKPVGLSLGFAFLMSKASNYLFLTSYQFIPLLFIIFLFLSLLSLLATKSVSREDMMLLVTVEGKIGMGNIISKRMGNFYRS